jgi:hypothetical protein
LTVVDEPALSEPDAGVAFTHDRSAETDQLSVPPPLFETSKEALVALEPISCVSKTEELESEMAGAGGGGGSVGLSPQEANPTANAAEPVRTEAAVRRFRSRLLFITAVPRSRCIIPVQSSVCDRRGIVGIADGYPRKPHEVAPAQDALEAV